jgi:hypothetical protein
VPGFAVEKELRGAEFNLLLGNGLAQAELDLLNARTWTCGYDSEFHIWHRGDESTDFAMYRPADESKFGGEF